MAEDTGGGRDRFWISGNGHLGALSQMLHRLSPLFNHRSMKLVQLLGLNCVWLKLNRLSGF